MLLGGHTHQIVDLDLQQARVANALAVFMSAELGYICLAVENFFANGPSKTQCVSKLANFRSLELHLAIHDEVYVGFGWLIFLIQALARLCLQKITSLKEVLKGVYRQKVEDWVLEPNAPKQELSSVVSLIQHLVVLSYVVP